MAKFTPQSGREAAIRRHARERGAQLEDRIRELVDKAPPLTEAQRARLARLLLGPAEDQRQSA